MNKSVPCTLHCVELFSKDILKVATNITCYETISVRNFVIIKIKSIWNKKEVFVVQITVIEGDNMEVIF